MPDMTSTRANLELREKLTELLGKQEQKKKSQEPKTARPSLSGQTSDNGGPSVAVESGDEDDVPPMNRRRRPRSGFQAGSTLSGTTDQGSGPKHDTHSDQGTIGMEGKST